MDFRMWCGEMDGTIQSVCVKNPTVNILCLQKFDICYTLLQSQFRNITAKSPACQTKVWLRINCEIEELIEIEELTVKFKL